MRHILSSAILLLLSGLPAHALEPGRIEGSFRINDTTIELRWAYAQLHDNAEGLLDHPKELRILLVDREMPSGVLDGITFLPVEDLARRGLVQGVMLELDPAAPDEVMMTLLYPPSEADRSLMTLSLGNSQRVITDWSFDGHRVAGVVERHEDPEWDFPDMPRLKYMLRFDTPVASEPNVTADLKRKEAQKSPLVRLLAARADALVRGDFQAVRSMSSERANRRNDMMLTSSASDEMKTVAKRAGTEMKKSLKSVQRVVVRGDRGVVIFPKKQWATFVMEGGEWKSDD